MACSRHRVRTRPALQKRVGSPDDENGKWGEKVQLGGKTHKTPGKSNVNCIYTCKVPDYVQRDDDAVKETSGKHHFGQNGVVQRRLRDNTKRTRPTDSGIKFSTLDCISSDEAE